MALHGDGGLAPAPSPHSLIFQILTTPSYAPLPGASRSCMGCTRDVFMTVQHGKKIIPKHILSACSVHPKRVIRSLSASMNKLHVWSLPRCMPDGVSALKGAEKRGERREENYTSTSVCLVLWTCDSKDRQQTSTQ